MKPPQNLALSASRDRAAAGRLFRVNAAISSPGARPLSLGRAGLEAAASTVKRRRAVEAREERARRIGRRLDAGFRALAARPIPRATWDKMAEDAGRAAGEDSPVKRRKLTPAELERAAREVMNRTGLGYLAARKAIEEYA